MAREHPARIDLNDPRHYACTLCGQQVPDGASVLASYDGNDKLIGVRAENADGLTLHECGKPVHGKDLTPRQRVAARADADYAKKTAV